jgi:carbonic anhydrase
MKVLPLLANSSIVRLLVLAATLASPLPGSAGAEPGGASCWGYEGRVGPAYWPQLRQEYAACGVGHMQSPVDIPTARAHRAGLDAIEFSYETVPLRVIDNGHTVQVNFGPGSQMRLGALRYELKQLHFHLPSEEAIDGWHFPMVAHLVHKDQEGRLAVVAVMLAEGRENAFFRSVLNYVPLDKGVERTVLYRPVNALKLLPHKRSYFSFAGSLTTPPCSEGVSWYVLQQPVEVSRAQLEAFARLYRNNVRPLQPLNGRPIQSGG